MLVAKKELTPAAVTGGFVDKTLEIRSVTASSDSSDCSQFDCVN